MENKTLISIIVPCFNEEESLFPFHRETKKVLDSMQAAENAVKSDSMEGKSALDYEMIFVDDGSSDRTLELMRELQQKDSHCRYVSFSRNFGKEAAMYAGLNEAKGDFCVIMDADLQHPPALLPKMYEAVSREGYDCCGGKRCGREGDGVLRSFCSRMFYKVGKRLTHMEMADGYGDFRMMNRKMVDAILEIKEYNRYMKGIYSFVGFQTKWIPYENVERENGSSKWNMKSLLAYAMEGILSFSTAPLKLAGLAGGMLLLAAAAFLLGNLIGVLLGAAALTDFDILLTVILFLGGMQMMFLYIVGIYLSKDCMENKKRPLYIVKERR